MLCCVFQLFYNVLYVSMVITHMMCSMFQWSYAVLYVSVVI